MVCFIGNTMLSGFEDKVGLLCKRLVNYCNSLALYCTSMLLIFVIVCFEWGEYAGFYPVFFISILPVEIKLSKERDWDPNDQVNLPNDCACSKPGFRHLQNIYKLWSYMFNCYLKSGDNYIRYSHHESKSTYSNKCGTRGGRSDFHRKTGIPLTTILDKLSTMRSLLQIVLFFARS